MLRLKRVGLPRLVSKTPRPSVSKRIVSIVNLPQNLSVVGWCVAIDVAEGARETLRTFEAHATCHRLD